MSRTVLFAASVCLLGCGMPFQLLVHNDLAEGAEITIRWYESNGDRARAQDETVYVRKGRAEQASLWYGPPDDEKGVDFVWHDRRGDHRFHVSRTDLTDQTYHAYVGADGVRFAKRDAMDRLHEAFTGLHAPLNWGCLLITAIPLGLLARRLAERRTGAATGDPRGR